MTAIDELALLLRPAGGGVHLVSAGREEQLAAQRRLYGVTSDEAVQSAFLDRLSRIGAARTVLLGVPSDVGAGFLRGANQGPLAIRQRLLEEDPAWLSAAQGKGLLDLGDVFVVPQLLHDDMLAEAQKDASRRALYPGLSPEASAGLPVSPLSIAERALDLVLSLNPAAAPVLLGGDHSTAWPAVAALSRVRPGMGVVQVDAHTDLLEERLGVKYCFGTWSFHANELLGRRGRLVQLGIRVSRHDRAHWESTLGVRQLWAKEILAGPDAALDAAIHAVRASGSNGVYFSNDVDGTDAAWVDATGTPEPGGLEPDFVVELIRRVSRDVGLVGGDVMEVAPLLARTPGGADRTLGVAARYLRETVDALLGVRF